jgi:hypothetical protein
VVCGRFWNTLGFTCDTPLNQMLDEVIPWARQQVDLGNL